jgi:hypothetical protein
MPLSEMAGNSAPYELVAYQNLRPFSSCMPNTLGLFPRFITLDLQIEVRPRLEIRILLKFLIMKKSVQAIWQGQNKDNQVETKDRFVVVS